MFCEQCGGETEAAAKFCGDCGARIPPDAGSSFSLTGAPTRTSAPAPELGGLEGKAARVAGKFSETGSSSRSKTARAQRPTPPEPAGLDRLAARVAGKLPETGPPSTARPAIASSPNKNELGGYVKWAYLGGMVLIAFGARLAFFITRISTNLVTGQTSTSYPDLGIGIVLVVIGIVIAGGARLADKGWLN